MENKIYIKNLFGDWKETNNKEEIDAHIRKHSIMENIDSVEEMLHYLKTLFVKGIDDDTLIRYIKEVNKWKIEHSL